MRKRVGATSMLTRISIVETLPCLSSFLLHLGDSLFFTPAMTSSTHVVTHRHRAYSRKPPPGRTCRSEGPNNTSQAVYYGRTRPISLKSNHQSKRGQRIIATAASIPRGGSHPRTARRIECVHVNVIFPKFKGDAPIRVDRDIATLVDQYSTVDTD